MPPVGTRSAGLPAHNSIFKSLLRDMEQWRATQEPLQVRDEEMHGNIDPGLRVVGTVGQQQRVVQPVHRVAPFV